MSLDCPRSFDCADVERFGDAYVDGEFEAPEREQFEVHLGACAQCRDGLQRLASLRSMIRAHVSRQAAAPEELRRRILGELERFQPEAKPEGPILRWSQALWPVLCGAATAGALSIFYVTVVPQRADRWVVGDAAEMHARALPLEISTGRLDQLMPLFEHHLGFAVRPPPLQQSGVLLEGGRLSHLGAHDAAYLQYGDPSRGTRLSLFIVEDPGATLRLVGARRTVLDGREMFIAQAHGHNVVVWRNQDVVYSLVSDLDERDTLSLLSH